MKKNLLTVLILGLLIVNIALTGIMMFSVMKTNNQTNLLISNIATVLGIEKDNPDGTNAGEKPDLEDLETYVLSSGTMTIPLKQADGDTKTKYIMFDISFDLYTKHDDYKKYGELLGSKENLIKDAVTSVVSAHTESECRGNLEGLKDEILKAVRDLFQSDFIYGVYISDVKFG